MFVKAQFIIELSKVDYRLKSAMVFKKGYKKPKKVVKKWQKTVFNPDFYQPFNIYRKQGLQN